MNERLFYVRPTNRRTAAKWLQATGCELLPVRSSEPAMTPAGCLAYRVDASRLTANERTRLIGYLVLHCWMGSKRMTYDEARLAVVEGVPVAAADCELVQEQESTPAPAFVLGRVMQPAFFLC